MSSMNRLMVQVFFFVAVVGQGEQQVSDAHLAVFTRHVVAGHVGVNVLHADVDPGFVHKKALQADASTSDHFWFFPKGVEVILNTIQKNWVSFLQISREPAVGSEKMISK